MLVDLQRDQVIDVGSAELSIELPNELHLVAHHGSQLEALSRIRFEHFALVLSLNVPRAFDVLFGPRRALPLVDPLLFDDLE